MIYMLDAAGGFSQDIHLHLFKTDACDWRPN
jgi:hypothetical protein